MNAKHTTEEQLNSCLKENRLPFTKTKEEVWPEVKNRIETAEVRSISSRVGVRYIRYAAAAAVIAILVSVSAIILSASEIESNQTIASLNLPDGSEVTLNKNTAVSYNSLLWYFNRSVKLKSGEAFFEVTEGGKFTVQTPNGKVEVLGTSFNVSTSENDFTVACKTGKVRVTDKTETSEVILSPGKKTQLFGKELAISAIQTDRIDSWMKESLVFKNADIEDVFRTLEESLGYTISYDLERKTKYSGQFDIHQPINEVLDIVCLPSGFEYRILESEKRIIITNK